jgi:hypothetical protein
VRCCPVAGAREYKLAAELIPAITAGKQFKVARNDILMTNKLHAEVGRPIRLEKVGVGNISFVVLSCGGFF